MPRHNLVTSDQESSLAPSTGHPTHHEAQTTEVCFMATIRRLRGRWQAQVRRKGIPPRAKSFDSKIDAEKWARNLEAELDRCGLLPDTRLDEQMTVRALFERYLKEITPHKRSASTEVYRLKAMLKRDIAYRTLATLTQ